MRRMHVKSKFVHDRTNGITGMQLRKILRTKFLFSLRLVLLLVRGKEGAKIVQFREYYFVFAQTWFTFLSKVGTSHEATSEPRHSFATENLFLDVNQVHTQRVITVIPCRIKHAEADTRGRSLRLDKNLLPIMPTSLCAR